MRQRDKIVRMTALAEAADAVCYRCERQEQTHFSPNGSAVHVREGRAFPCAASPIHQLYHATAMERPARSSRVPDKREDGA